MAIPASHHGAAHSLPGAIAEAFASSATLGMPELCRLIPMDDKTLRKHLECGNIVGLIRGFGTRKARRMFTQQQVADFLAKIGDQPTQNGPASAPRMSSRSPRILKSRRCGPNLARGFIYFLFDGEFIKIGWSKKCGDRVPSLQVGNARQLKVLGVCKGTPLFENKLHHKFRRHHVRGEWHRPDTEILDFIAAIEPTDLQQ